MPPRKIAPTPVRVRVWFKVRVRIRVGGQSSPRAIVLESSKDLITFFNFVLILYKRSVRYKNQVIKNIQRGFFMKLNAEYK